ncbi:hypothetical protein QTP70_008177 [Hemibagrus guttatus]|uniref:Paired domain-containing protein n=1 Tax=Hemibagrus guttatus TaxID=175788 RepID=A0AAE0URQ2_9TELE|nr:hypothetical protein QTP70_008177 [Hemibagrus guttatus]
MGRGSPIPPMLRRKIVEQYQKGVSQRKIAKSLKLSSSTVHNVIQRFRESGTISVRKGQGRKTILDAHDLRALRRHCITYRNATWAQEHFQETLSVNTIHRAIRRCRLKLYRSKKKPYLNMIQKRRRFLWAKAHLKWTVAKWKTVLWSDESKFEVLFGKLVHHVIQTKEDKDNPSCYQRSVQKPAFLMINALPDRPYLNLTLLQSLKTPKPYQPLAQKTPSNHSYKNTSGQQRRGHKNRPGLTTTAIGTVDLQGAGGNWATVGRRSRGGRRVRRQREKRKGKSVGLRIGTLNVGTMTGKGRELADMMERRMVDILCVQETRWKGSKARSIGAGFKLFYYGVDSKRNGVGVVLKEKFVRNVLEVKRVSDRVMSLKLEIEGVMLNVVSGYAPQVGCELEEKERFWSELDEVMESIPTGERVVIGVDFNGHVGEGNTGDEEVMGKFGVKERNLEGQMVVDFAKRMDMAVVNTYFQKREEHRVTYKSGGKRTQVDYILCRRGNLKEISDCKVVVGESVARQHRMVVCRMTLLVCKTKRSKIEIEKKTKWWKLKKEECCEEFRQKLRQALGGQVVLPDDWETTAEVIRETGRKVLGVSSGRRKEDKETWWWNEEV